MSRTSPVSPGEIEIRNYIQRAVSGCLEIRKDDQINIASKAARKILTREITNNVMKALKTAYRE